jgi:hypothetical protein
MILNEEEDPYSLPDKKDDKKIPERPIPIVPRREPKPVEVNPDSEVIPFPNQITPKNYNSIVPVTYSNDNFQRQPFYQAGFNGRLVSRLEAQLQHYGQRAHQNYYRR